MLGTFERSTAGTVTADGSTEGTKLGASEVRPPVLGTSGRKIAGTATKDGIIDGAKLGEFEVGIAETVTSDGDADGDRLGTSEDVAMLVTVVGALLVASDRSTAGIATDDGSVDGTILGLSERRSPVIAMTNGDPEGVILGPSDKRTPGFITKDGPRDGCKLGKSDVSDLVEAMCSGAVLIFGAWGGHLTRFVNERVDFAEPAEEYSLSTTARRPNV
jgi:hypothetical protein